MAVDVPPRGELRVEDERALRRGRAGRDRGGDLEKARRVGRAVRARGHREAQCERDGGGQGALHDLGAAASSLAMKPRTFSRYGDLGWSFANFLYAASASPGLFSARSSSARKQLGALFLVGVLGRGDDLLRRAARRVHVPELPLGGRQAEQRALAHLGLDAGRVGRALEPLGRAVEVEAGVERAAGRVRLLGREGLDVLRVDLERELAVGVDVLVRVPVEIAGVLESLHEEHEPAFGIRDENGGRFGDRVALAEHLAFVRLELDLDGHHPDEQRLEVEGGVQQPLHPAAVVAGLSADLVVDELVLRGGALLRKGHVRSPFRVAGARHGVVRLGVRGRRGRRLLSGAGGRDQVQCEDGNPGHAGESISILHSARKPISGCGNSRRARPV